MYIQCTLSPPCSAAPPFSTIATYEEHYEISHMNSCATCHRILPTAHLLHLHIQELHDSFFKVMASRCDSYECFVDDCAVKTRSSNARIRHLIKRHAYPQDFDFRVIRGHYIDHRHDTSATCLNEGQNESSDKVEIVNTTSTLPGGACDSDVDLEKLTTSMSLLMVPRVMRVGRKAPATQPAKLT
ncbi:hypothetical protein BASA62_003906 [Batrachochytrium salamandrivorans]|nr:hypothetical protein BASA62_003906 [Batrachochytrium salamandrivorans]